MWPFIAAGFVTYYFVAKAQAAGIQCKPIPVTSVSVAHAMITAEEFKNDPSNPYREQLSKQEAHH